MRFKKTSKFSYSVLPRKVFAHITPLLCTFAIPSWVFIRNRLHLTNKNLLFIEPLMRWTVRHRMCRQLVVTCVRIIMMCFTVLFVSSLEIVSRAHIMNASGLAMYIMVCSPTVTTTTTPAINTYHQQKYYDYNLTESTWWEHYGGRLRCLIGSTTACM